MRLNEIEKKLALRASAALIAMLLGIGVCGASPIVYQVNETINLGGVTGTIETDGTIGMLTAAHIIGWDLTLMGPGAPDYEITNNNSVVQLTGSAVSATLDNLFFNYSAGNGSGLLFQQGLFSGLTYWCNSAGYFACFDSESVAPQSFFSTSYQHISRVGNQGKPRSLPWVQRAVCPPGVHPEKAMALGSSWKGVTCAGTGPSWE